MIASNEMLASLITNLCLNKDVFYGGDFILLTRHNSSEIEKEISKDYDYIPFAKYIYEYFIALRFHYSKFIYDDFIAIIREIDRDNKTNVWRYGNEVKIKRVVDYMFDSKNNFFDELDKGDVDLPDKINNYVGGGMKSLSSKICKYLSEYIFNKDNYYINDKYIRAMSLFYYEYYCKKSHSAFKNISDIDNLKYEELHKLLDVIRYAANPSLLRSEFDHIIWY